MQKLKYLSIVLLGVLANFAAFADDLFVYFPKPNPATFPFQQNPPPYINNLGISGGTFVDCGKTNSNALWFANSSVTMTTASVGENWGFTTPLQWQYSGKNGQCLASGSTVDVIHQATPSALQGDSVDYNGWFQFNIKGFSGNASFTHNGNTYYYQFCSQDTVEGNNVKCCFDTGDGSCSQ